MTRSESRHAALNFTRLRAKGRYPCLYADGAKTPLAAFLPPPGIEQARSLKGAAHVYHPNQAEELAQFSDT